MGGTATGTTAGPPLDALRRRLYAKDATEEDVVAYRAAAATAAVDERPAPTGRRTSRRTLALIGGAVTVAALSAFIALRPLAAVPVASGPTPTAAVRTVASTDVVLPAPQSARAAFVDDLEARSGAGLLEYLYGHPSFLPQALRAPTWGHVTEHSGTGASRVDLSPTDLDGDAGRLTVVVVVDRAARLSWRPAVSAGDEGPSPWHRVDARAGVPVSATVPYSGGAPSTLEVDVPDGTSWGALVALTN